MTPAELKAQSIIRHLLEISRDILARFGARLLPREREALEEATTGFPPYLEPGAEGLDDPAFVKHVEALKRAVERLRKDLKRRKPMAGHRR